MLRRPRIVLPDVPLHLIQRGNNRQACFSADDDYRAYLGWLEKYAQEVHCTVHAYVVMTNHAHLLGLATPGTSARPRKTKQPTSRGVFFEKIID